MGQEFRPDEMRLSVLVGHPGSGKTEVGVNLVLALADLGHPVALADLDTVNPYFRSREQQALLRARGIRLVTSSQSCADADVPAIPAELNTLLENQNLHSVLDLGGGPGGARVLARFRMKLRNIPHRVCFVLNANRPATNTVEGAIDALKEIEVSLGLPVTHIIHNTHLCSETEEEDIRFGAKLAQELSQQTGIPILCHSVHHKFIPCVSDLEEPLFPLHIHMLKPWELQEL